MAPRTSFRWVAGTVLISALTTVPLAAAEPTYRLTFGAELASVLGTDRHEDVYGSPQPGLNLGIEVDFDERWYLATTMARGISHGTDTLRVAEPRRTDSRFRRTTLDFTAGRISTLGSGWSLLFGAGPTALHWREENDLLDREDSGLGAHLEVGLRRRSGSLPWGLTLQATWVPDGLEDRAGTTRPVAEEDYLAISLDLSASPAFRGPGSAEPDAASRTSGLRRWELRWTTGSVFATHVWRFSNSAVAQQSADHDPYLTLGLGLEVRLSGPFGVALEVSGGEADLESRLDYFNTGTVFVSSGKNEAWIGSLGLPVRLLERPFADLRLVPTVSYLRYDVSTRGGFSLEGTDELWTAGLSVASRLGRGPWGLHLAFRYPGLVRLRSDPAAFEFEPIELQTGLSWRPRRTP